ncbi:hypothetical protein HPB49_010012 [Dermacentor silvarum]|uniref:Uncharacterized protein n=1 Tax=Dermacentor silvarum TaxID=543639 RepID=A0ACB8CQN0_DERSI|nr:hypothetical protein HPB49_010012 [Dermacentor silvarum]
MHKNEHLSNANRFKYLKSYLAGKAEDTITGLSLTDSNYEIAVDLLKEWFLRKEVAVNDHLSGMLQLKPVVSADDVISLRLLYGEKFKNVRGLEALDVKQKAYSALLKVAAERCQHISIWSCSLCTNRGREFRSNHKTGHHEIKSDPTEKVNAFTIRTAGSSDDSKTHVDSAERHIDRLGNVLLV